MSEPRVHVVYGTGSLGLAVMREATRRGHRVRGVSRSGKVALPAGVELLRGDASDPKSTRELCSGADVVHVCAAPAYTDWQRFPAMQAAIVEGAAAAGARLISSENVYVYGKVEGPMTEDTPIAPCSRKGEIRAQMNRALLEAHQAGKLRVALALAPDYYGPAATATTIYGERVFYPALQGKSAQVFGKLDALHSLMYVDDFAHGMVTLGERDEGLGRAWHLACPPPLTQRAMLELIFRAAGQPEAKVQAMPGFMVRVLGWFIPILRELAEMQYQWERDYLFDCSQFTRVFGADHVRPHAETIVDTLAWFRDHPPG
ncbi:NAD-dependent epimerase/dehydratase family protein [Nannocystaceae bacterium ST9]